MPVIQRLAVKLAAAALALPLLFPAHAAWPKTRFTRGARWASRTLSDFKIATTSSRYEFTAHAAEGFIGSITPVLAARDVRVALTDKQKRRTEKYECLSFTFEMNDSFATCETGTRSLVFDLTNSEISFYPSRR